MKISTTAAGRAPHSALRANPLPVEQPRDQLVGSVESLPSPGRPQLTRTGGPSGATLAAAQEQVAWQAAGLARPDLLREADPAVRFVHRFNSELDLAPEVLEKRNELTASSAAKFFRVNPALFYEDVLGVYNQLSLLIPSRPSPPIIIAGDCHLGNFGTLRAKDGTTFWGINDFDMAGKGTAEDDLERMATSLHLMSPLNDEECKTLVEHMANRYLDELASLSVSGATDHGGITLGEAYGEVAKLIRKKSGATQEHLLEEFCEGDRLKRNHELKNMTAHEKEMVEGFLPQWETMVGETPELVRPLQVLDMARKTESGGSTYGLNRFFILVEGRDHLPRILELKQELPTAPEQNTGNTEEANADYIFSCMKALGGTFDPTMAAGTIDENAYYVRERQREKGALPINDYETVQQWQDLVEQAAVALARAHAFQSGAAQKILEWVGPDRPQLIERLQNFAEVYARQTEVDRDAFKLSLSPCQAESEWPKPPAGGPRCGPH